MQVKEGEVTFSMKRKGENLGEGEFLEAGDFPRLKRAEISGFKTPIINPIALLTGFDVEFEPPAGRPFGNLDIRVAVEDVFDDTVTVKVIFGLRDWSGDWDDEHKGTIRFNVIAD